MWSIIQAAGWPIYPLLLCSVISLAIIAERAWVLWLSADKIVPQGLVEQVAEQVKKGALTAELIRKLESDSLLGVLFSSALINVNASREIMKEAIEESGRAVAHSLDRYLTTLGTIATVSPLLGLLGTVIGMVELFGAFNAAGSGHDVAQFAKGISVALYNTAMGIVVAVPSMIAYRHFRARVDSLIVEMEQQSIKLVEVLHGERK